MSVKIRQGDAWVDVSGGSGSSTSINATEDTSSLLYPVMVASGGSNQIPKIRTTPFAFQLDSANNTLYAGNLRTGIVDAATPNIGSTGGVRIRANPTTGVSYLQFIDSNATAELANINAQSISYYPGLADPVIICSRSLYINDSGLGGDLLSNGGTDGQFAIYNTSGVVGRMISFSILNEPLTNYDAVFRMYRNGVNGQRTVDCPYPGTLFAVNGTKSFRIDHPVDDSKYLYHTSIEGPRADLIYRGKATLQNGTATINLDNEYGLIPGTWTALCRNPQVWITNNEGWDFCRGKMNNEVLTIESQNQNCSDTIDWMVIAERQDKAMYNSSSDENGRPLLEIDKNMS